MSRQPVLEGPIQLHWSSPETAAYLTGLVVQPQGALASGWALAVAATHPRQGAHQVGQRTQSLPHQAWLWQRPVALKVGSSAQAPLPKALRCALLGHLVQVAVLQRGPVPAGRCLGQAAAAAAAAAAGPWQRLLAAVHSRWAGCQAGQRLESQDAATCATLVKAFVGWILLPHSCSLRRQAAVKNSGFGALRRVALCLLPALAVSCEGATQAFTEIASICVSS